jgi:hypothetical protein
MASVAPPSTGAVETPTQARRRDSFSAAGSTVQSTTPPSVAVERGGDGWKKIPLQSTEREQQEQERLMLELLLRQLNYQSFDANATVPTLLFHGHVSLLFLALEFGMLDVARTLIDVVCRGFCPADLGQRGARRAREGEPACRVERRERMCTRNSL